MGTRGFIGFVNKGREYITYNHFDSYPSGLGVTVLDWARGADLDKVREQVSTLVLVDEQSKPTLDQQAELIDHADFRVSEQTSEDWYALLRETQGDLQRTLDCGYMIDSHEFPHDSLFCEWGYLIDLDTGCLEVYQGFQKDLPGSGRWANHPTAEEDAAEHAAHVKWCAENDREPWMPEVSEYKAVTMVAAYSLYDLPSETAFLAKLEDED